MNNKIHKLVHGNSLKSQELHEKSNRKKCNSTYQLIDLQNSWPKLIKKILININRLQSLY